MSSAHRDVDVDLFPDRFPDETVNDWTSFYGDDRRLGAVRLMIETDKRATYQQTRTSFGVGMSQVHKVLDKHLAVKKLYTW
ncbi:hypothetical protein EVAR_32046_1 [Eumeta japonica]|uniref:Uncharacterized protein n=1 Tax=Eumeta variegata TaxID=151549 RepID=A0A4C1WNQ0_EUMVA|nr:hypothetical protein EVAR_32046_1 [Eumeta japonica]